jgi:hypothetical protein
MAALSGTCTDYYPVWTELQGLGAIGLGSLVLALGGATKVHDFITQRKTIIPYISDDAGTFWCSVGKMAMNDGCQKIAPALFVILASSAIAQIADDSSVH